MRKLTAAAAHSRYARRVGRRQALLVATVGLAVACVVAAVVCAPSNQITAFNGVERAHFAQSLGLAVAALYGWAWLGGSRLGAVIGRRPPGVWRVGAAYGIIALLLAWLVGSAWNFGQEAIRYMLFPGTTAADFHQHMLNCLVDYVGKPVAWVVPLGGLLAAVLGGWLGKRIRAGLTTASRSNLPTP